MIVAFANSKGGVGKTTLAVHMAVWLAEKGARVALVDSDVQGSSSLWLREASPNTRLHRLQTPDEVLEQVPGIRAETDFVIIDGPAGLSEVTRAVLLVSDIALLPCGPSVLDLRAVNDAIRVVKQAQAIRQGPPRAMLVPNKLQVQYRLSQELLETAQKLEIPTAGGIRLRQAYADAAGQGTVVWKLGRRGEEAALEMTALLSELVTYESSTEKHERSTSIG